MNDRKRALRSSFRRGFRRREFIRAVGAGSGLGSLAVGGGSARRTGREWTDGQQSRGTWREGPSLPDERTEVGAAALGGNLYVVGGFVPDGVTAGVAVYEPRDRATATEGETETVGEWRGADPLPEPRHHVGTAALDGSLYVVGGFRDRGFDPVATVWRYDGSGWEERAPLPTARGGLAVEAIDGRIYAAGGEDADGSVTTLTAYDPNADEWTERAPMPTARNHLASEAVGGRLYAVGGRTGFPDLLGANEGYDPDADEWMELAPMPTPRGGLSGGSLGGQVVAAGGEGPGGTFEEVEAYDPDADDWRALPPLPTARHGLGVATIDGDLYAAAGGPDPGFAFSDVLEVFHPSASGATTTAR